MGDLIKSGFKGNELSELNRCQMYINFTCLSDVSTGDGLRIPPSSWKGTQRKREEQHLLPFQQKPPNRAWENWQAALHLIYKLDKTLDLPHHRRLVKCLSGLDTTGCTYPPSQYRIYYLSDTGWLPYRLLLRRKGGTATDASPLIMTPLPKIPP